MSNARQLAANLPREGGFGLRNFIVNGEMQVAQRGVSVSFGAGYTLDRWRIVGGASPARVATQESNTSYSTLPHEKFLKCTNPQGQDMWVNQRIENARQFSGKTLTISYWVWSTTGSYSATSGSWGALQAANSNQYNVSGWGGATVSVTTTPQHVTHTINFADISSYAHTEGDFYEWNIYHNTTNDICITGVQLEVGDTATPFEHRSYGDELARCQRYFQKSASQSSALTSTAGMVYSRDGTASAVQRYIPVRFVQTMRTSPTVTLYDGALNTGKLSQDTTNNLNAFVSSLGDQAMMVYGPSGTSHYSTRFGYYVDAEL